MTIAIIGGGIAGLALALGLHRRGVPCTVLEAAPEMRELGVGITLLPHGMAELTALGLQDKLLAAGIENRESAFYNRFGQLIYREPRGRRAGYALPEVGIGRGRLHGILHAAVVERLGPGAILQDRRCTGVEQDESGVTVRFDAAAPVRADAAIACDGINSAVRRQFYPAEQLAFAGINTWRGTTRRAPILDGRTYLRVGSIRTGKMVIYPIADHPDGSQTINWVAEIERAGSPRNDWNRAGRREELAPLFGAWRFDWLDVADLIERAETVLEYPMVDRDPVDRWTFGRVTLAGDAAHPMYPRGSNGSAQSLIDARTLADLLAARPAPEALAAYEQARLAPTAAIVRTNRSNPPDIINIHVEDLTGDRPFDDLDAIVSQDELRALSDRYKQVAGFAAPAMAAPALAT